MDLYSVRQSILSALLLLILLGASAESSPGCRRRKRTPWSRYFSHGHQEAIDYLQHAQADPGDTTLRSPRRRFPYELAVHGRLNAAAQAQSSQRHAKHVASRRRKALAKFLAERSPPSFGRCGRPSNWATCYSIAGDCSESWPSSIEGQATPGTRWQTAQVCCTGRSVFGPALRSGRMSKKQADQFRMPQTRAKRVRGPRPDPPAVFAGTAGPGLGSV